MINIYNIPNGPKNLAPLFPGLDFDDIESYYIRVYDNTDPENLVTLATTTRCINEGLCSDDVVLHFVNYLGAVDSIVMKNTIIDHETKSDQYQLIDSDIKNVHGINRTNIRSNQTHQAEGEFYEEDMEWLQELLDSPFVWVEWDGIQSQSDDYIPVVIVDKTVRKKKVEDRYSYTITIDYKLSHEKIITRG